MNAARAGNRAACCPFEGYRVSSVASLEMAAGLSALSAIHVPAQPRLRSSRMDQSRRTKRLVPNRSDDCQWHRETMLAGTAVSSQKHTEFMFGGSVASCYPWCPTGAEGVVIDNSRRPN
ncbi:hypothetical protein CWO91_08915 [Bradyrhizobium genosp. SA-3]|nr:hypothetical protein CWO91_08915 [Bradyrhizobium genosp. SA-3]